MIGLKRQRGAVGAERMIGPTLRPERFGKGRVEGGLVGRTEMARPTSSTARSGSPRWRVTRPRKMEGLGMIGLLRQGRLIRAAQPDRAGLAGGDRSPHSGRHASFRYLARGHGGHPGASDITAPRFVAEGPEAGREHFCRGKAAGQGAWRAAILGLVDPRRGVGRSAFPHQPACEAIMERRQSGSFEFRLTLLQMMKLVIVAAVASLCLTPVVRLAQDGAVPWDFVLMGAAVGVPLLARHAGFSPGRKGPHKDRLIRLLLLTSVCAGLGVAIYPLFFPSAIWARSGATTGTMYFIIALLAGPLLILLVP